MYRPWEQNINLSAYTEFILSLKSALYFQVPCVYSNFSAVQIQERHMHTNCDSKLQLHEMNLHPEHIEKIKQNFLMIK
jgi:hypothetical protein